MCRGFLEMKIMESEKENICASRESGSEKLVD